MPRLWRISGLRSVVVPPERLAELVQVAETDVQHPRPNNNDQCDRSGEDCPLAERIEIHTSLPPKTKTDPSSVSSIYYSIYT